MAQLGRTWTPGCYSSLTNELQPDIEIKSEFVNMVTPLKCCCKIDNHTWNIVPHVFVTYGNGCPICARKNNGKRYSQAIQGVNDVATLYPSLIKYFKYEKDAYFYKRQSNQKVEMVCPYCKTEKKMTIYSLTTRGFSCPMCGDGVSYPNKIGRSFIMQLPVKEIEFEWHPKWLIGLKRFDIKFCFSKQTYVMEMDGYQHYVEDVSFTHKKLLEIKEEDKLKDDLCAKNKVIMIRIDCRRNTLIWIKEHIMQSELAKIFDLDKIDWEKCDIYANNSFIAKTGELWNKGLDLLQISQELKVSRSTVQRYIKIADNIGFCKYDKLRGLQNGIKKNSKIIRWIETGQEFLNCKICAEKVYEQTGIRLSVTGIRSVVYGECRHTKGFHLELCEYKPNEISKDVLERSVCCYDMSGKFVCKFNNIMEAADDANTSPKSIIECCEKKTKKSGNRIWKYADKVEVGKDFVADLTKRGIEIDCLSLDGIYIESFPSAMVAIRKYTRATNSGIGRCCMGKQKTSGGYCWQYSKRP